MKQTRRQELKTNELSVILQQMYETIQEYSNYIIGGVLIVAIVLVIGLVYKQNRRNTLQGAWVKINEIREKNVTDDPGLLDNARILANEFGADKDLGPTVLALYADLNYQLAMDTTGQDKQQSKIEYLENAKAEYEKIIINFGNHDEAVQQAHMSLAKVEESLVLAGKGSKEAVIKHYQILADNDKSPYQTIAKDQLESLDKRLAKLEIAPAPPKVEPPKKTEASSQKTIQVVPQTQSATKPAGK